MSKPYIVAIEEVYRRKVIVWAEDPGDAAATADELCKTGEIIMNEHSHRELIAVTMGVAEKEELSECTQFGFRENEKI